MKFPNLAKLFASIFGVGNNTIQLDEKSGAVTLTKEQFDATEEMAGQLISLKDEKGTLEQTIAENKTEKETLQNTIGTLTTERDGLKTAATNIIAECGLESTATAEEVVTKIKELKAMPGGKAIVVGATTEQVLSEVQVKEVMDNLPHNQLADERLGK